MAKCLSYAVPNTRVVGSVLAAAAFFPRSLSKDLVSEVCLQTPLMNVFSVAEWLALLR